MGRLKNNQIAQNLLAQSDIGGYCQQQNPLFSKYKRQPDCIIKVPHRTCRLSKCLITLIFTTYMITEMATKNQAKSACVKCNYLHRKHLHHKNPSNFCFLILTAYVNQLKLSGTETIRELSASYRQGLLNHACRLLCPAGR